MDRVDADEDDPPTTSSKSRANRCKIDCHATTHRHRQVPCNDANDESEVMFYSTSDSEEESPLPPSGNLVQASGDFSNSSVPQSPMANNTNVQLRNGGVERNPTPPPGIVIKECVFEPLVDVADSCCICSDPYNDSNPRSFVRCGHAFHFPCLLEWQQRRAVCPLCLTPLTEGGATQRSSSRTLRTSTSHQVRVARRERRRLRRLARDHRTIYSPSLHDVGALDATGVEEARRDLHRSPNYGSRVRPSLTWWELFLQGCCCCCTCGTVRSSSRTRRYIDDPIL